MDVACPQWRRQWRRRVFNGDGVTPRRRSWKHGVRAPSPSWIGSDGGAPSLHTALPYLSRLEEGRRPVVPDGGTPSLQSNLVHRHDKSADDLQTYNSSHAVGDLDGLGYSMERLVGVRSAVIAEQIAVLHRGRSAAVGTLSEVCLPRINAGTPRHSCENRQKMRPIGLFHEKDA